MNRNYHSNLAFLDILFNTLLCFVALFAVALLVINPNKDNKKIDVKAEFIITASWPGHINDDIDLYVEDPNGNLVYFKEQEAGLMHLDRDDLGLINDSMKTEIGTIQYYDNREIVTIRGTAPGEYVVNLHAYSKREDDPVPVSLTIDKINPFRTVVSEIIVFTQQGQEKTICRFVLDSDGEVTEVNYLPKFFVQMGW